METPTPVSAAMHAGIINAGGFLVLRLSPLISLSHIALDFLAVMGATTAYSALVAMLTQTSIKRSLAYSTIAQMGFMMLQCGLGAYVGLSPYRRSLTVQSSRFLSSGSVLEMAAATNSLSMKRDNSRNLANTNKFMNPEWLALGTLAVVMPVGVAWLVR